MLKGRVLLSGLCYVSHIESCARIELADRNLEFPVKPLNEQDLSVT
jgi:hypothetical protein